MNPIHFMNSTLQNSFSRPTAAPYNSNIHPGSTSSMSYFSPTDWSSQSTLQLHHGQFQYSSSHPIPHTVSPVHQTQLIADIGVNGLTEYEMLLLNQDNLNLLKDLIAAFRANPNIIYMPGLTFFREYLESLKAKIPNKIDQQKPRNLEKSLDGVSVTPVSSIVEEKNDQIFLDFDDSADIDIKVRDYDADRIHHCNQCDKKYKGIHDLRKHMRMHTGDVPFKCNQCGKGFLSEKYLRRHMISHTGGDGSLKCNQCGKTFAYNSSLQYHLRAHKGVKPYKCKECGKTFSQNSRLNVHMRTHTGEQPYSCEHCERKFKLYNTWKMHLLIHIDEKPYQCKQCDKTFRAQTVLRRHVIRNHSGTPREKKKNAPSVVRLGSLRKVLKGIWMQVVALKPLIVWKHF